MSLQFLADLVIRRKKIMAWVLAVVMGLYVLVVLVQPSQYESTASIMVKVADQDVAMPELVSEQHARGAESSANAAEKLINSAQLIITSEDVLRRALEKVGAAKVYPRVEDRAARLSTSPTQLGAALLAKDLAVNVNLNTNVIRLSLFNVNPAIAQLTLQALIAATVEKEALVTRDPRLKFLEDKLGSLKKESEAAQRALLDFRKQTQITAFYEERSLLLKQRDAIELDFSQVQADVVAADRRARALQSSLRRTPHQVQLSDENDSMQHQIDEAQARLSAAQARYEAGRQRFAAGNPELLDEAAQVQSATANLEQLKLKPTTRRRFGASPVHQTLSEELSKTSSDADAHRGAIAQRKLQLKQINDRLAYLDSQELTVRELENRRDTVEQEYRSYLQRVQSARIVADMNKAGITSLSVLQPATLPYEPARPRKLLLFVLALLASLVLGVAVCMAVDNYDVTLSRPEDVQRVTGLRLLGVINMQD